MCQVCNILNTQETITPPGTNIVLRPGPFHCDSENVVYLLMCTRCKEGNYVGETKSKFRLRINNHKLSIRNHSNQPGYPVANHYNLRDHSISDLSCVILQGNFSSTKERKINEQKWALKLDCHNKGLNRDLAFLSHYSTFAK